MRRGFIFFPLFRLQVVFCLCLSPAAALAQNLYFFDLIVNESGEQLEVGGVPQTLVSHQILGDDAYHFSEAMTTVTLDAPVYQLLSAARKASAAGSLPAEGLPLATLKVDFILRELSGKRLDREGFHVTTRLLPGHVLEVHSKYGRKTFPLKLLGDESGYSGFLKYLFFPKGPWRFSKPRQNLFLTDLCYEITDVALPTWNNEGRDDAAYYLAVLKTNRLLIHMGTTFCERHEIGLRESRSNYLHYFGDLIRTYGKALTNGPETLTALESYHRALPSDPKALSLLVDRYIDGGDILKASHLATSLKPILESHPGGLEAGIYLSNKTMQKRRELLARKDSFKHVDGMVSISSPQSNDLVAGETWLEFELTRDSKRILQIECYADERRIASLQRPPFLVPFKADSKKTSLSLRVIAYFDDQTFDEAQITVKPVQVDEGQEVQLVSLRTVVPAGDRFLTNLKAEDFRIREQGRKRNIVSFIKDKAPLNIAVVFDTSVSMNGEKLHRAQYAIKSFLDRLGPDDRAAIYTFDRKVMRLTDYSHDFKPALARLLTITPKLSTSLYDALFVAHGDLAARAGRKVIIVVSDGNDSTSNVSSSRLISLLGASPVAVYPIIIEGEGDTSGHEGRVFLEGIAAQSGSIAIRVTRFTRFESVFSQIYDELKSFYILSYHSENRHVNARDLEVKVRRKRGAAPRFYRHLEAVYR